MINFGLKYIFLLIIIVLNNNVLSTTVNQDDLQLKFVFILSRHMNRAPLTQCENNCTNRIDWPRGLGELTDQGIWNAYHAGQMLRKRYIEFLHPLQRYTPKEIDVSTTPIDRCYQTAGYLLAGMYPPNEEQMWNKDLKWQPIPIKESLSKDHQNFFSDRRECPKYAMELNDKYENLVKTEKFKNLIDYMNKYISVPLNTSYDLSKLVDVIWTERMANYKVPNWAMKRWNDIEDYLLKTLFVRVETHKMKRLFSGDILNDVLTRMEASINKSPDAKKMYLHVGHDSTIVPFLKTINIENITYPFYGAAIIMELYATPLNETIVKLFYNKNYEWKESNIKLIELPGCPQPCRLEDWRTLTQNVIPHNLSKECEN